MVSPGFPFDPISTPYSSKRTAKNPPLISSKRTLGSLEVSLGQKGKSVRPVMTQQKDPNHARFLDETLWREKLSHRQPHRIIDALSKFELHRCLLRCVRVWGMLGPNWRRTCPTKTLGKISFCSFLDQLSRKIRRESHRRQDLLKLFQVVRSIPAGGASVSTNFARTCNGAAQHSPTLSDSPVILESLVD